MKKNDKDKTDYASQQKDTEEISREELYKIQEAVNQLRTEIEQLKQIIKNRGRIHEYEDRSIMTQYAAGYPHVGHNDLPPELFQRYAELFDTMLRGNESDRDVALCCLLTERDMPGNILSNIIKLKLMSDDVREKFRLPDNKPTIYDKTMTYVIAANIGRERSKIWDRFMWGKIMDKIFDTLKLYKKE